MRYAIIARYVADPQGEGIVTQKGKHKTFTSEDNARQWANDNLTLSSRVASFSIVPYTAQLQRQYTKKST